MSMLTDDYETWITKGLPRAADAIKTQPRPAFVGEMEVDDLLNITADTAQDFAGETAEAKVMYWRAGRAQILAGVAERLNVLGTNPHPDSTKHRKALVLGVIEHAWHEQGRPDPGCWVDGLDGERFGGDEVAAAAYRALIIECRYYADDECSPADAARGTVEDLVDIPRYAWIP